MSIARFLLYILAIGAVSSCSSTSSTDEPIADALLNGSDEQIQGLSITNPKLYEQVLFYLQNDFSNNKDESYISNPREQALISLSKARATPLMKSVYTLEACSRYRFSLCNNAISLAWRDLTSSSPGVVLERLNSYVSSTPDGTEVIGWLQLAFWQSQLNATGSYDTATFNNWLLENNNHPGLKYWDARAVETHSISILGTSSSSLPASHDDEYQPAINGSPRRLNILLPLTGSVSPLSRSLIDGFLSSNSVNENDIEYIDTDVVDVSQLSNYFSSDSIVIGPLLKGDVEKFASHYDGSFNWIALNESNVDSENAFCITLNPIDEATEILRKAYSDGNDTVLYLLSNSEKGRRTFSSYQKAAEKLGIQIPIEQDVVWLNGDASDEQSVIKKFDPSGQMQLQFSKLKLGQSIVPSYYSAVFLDVDRPRDFAIMDIISRIQDPRTKPIEFYLGSRSVKSFEIEGQAKVHFLTLPLMTSDLVPQDPVLANVENRRMFGLGADVAALIQLQSSDSNIEGKTISGLTGRLEIRHQGCIKRDFEWR